MLGDTALPSSGQGPSRRGGPRYACIGCQCAPRCSRGGAPVGVLPWPCFGDTLVRGCGVLSAPCVPVCLCPVGKCGVHTQTLSVDMPTDMCDQCGPALWVRVSCTRAQRCACLVGYVFAYTLASAKECRYALGVRTPHSCTPECGGVCGKRGCQVCELPGVCGFTSGSRPRGYLLAWKYAYALDKNYREVPVPLVCEG